MAHVDATLSEVAVHGAAIAILVHEGKDGAEIAAELGGIDGCILPAFPAGAYTGDEGGGPEGGLADAPDIFRFCRGVDAAGRVLGDGLERGD